MTPPRKSLLVVLAFLLLGGVWLLFRGPSLQEALNCAGLNSLPVGARDIKVSGESAGFGRCYWVRFSAEPQALQEWLARHQAGQTKSCNPGQLQLKPDNIETIARCYVTPDASGSAAILFVELSL